MKTSKLIHPIDPATAPRKRRIRLSAKHLLAAGALAVAIPTPAVEIFDDAGLQTLLNRANFAAVNFDIQLEIRANIDLDTNDFFVGAAGRGLARFSSPDVGAWSITNGGSITVLSANDVNYSLLTLDPSVEWDAQVILNDTARLDIDGPAALGTNATVTMGETGDAEIRLYTFDGDTNDFDQDFFDKITGVNDLTRFAITGDGVTQISGNPGFDAIFQLNQYSDYAFAGNPNVDPTMQLTAGLAGNHSVVINVGTLDLNDNNLTIDSLSGVAGTAITLGTGILTTGDATDTTYAGVISGTGNLVKTGTGIFTLTGENTFSGTLSVNAGTLNADGALTAVSGILVDNTGTLNLNADVNDTVNVSINAGGTVNLNDLDQTFASIDGAGDINLGSATLTVGDALNTTLSGVISGTGNLTKNGTGNLTLSGMNTFTGQTVINAGTITLDGDLTNGRVTIATGATLDLNDNDETLTRITGMGTVDLGTATLTLDSGGSDSTFDGTVIGTGANALIFTGGRTTTFTQAQTYTGTTVINSGIFVANGDLATSGVTVQTGGTFALESTLTNPTGGVTVDDGGTLFGDGTIDGGNDLTNNGTLTFIGPGANDTLDVTGDFTQGATGLLQVQLGNPIGLNVTGTANLGGTVDITGPADPSTFDTTLTYNVFNAGATAGTFATFTFTDSFAYLDIAFNGVNDITLARNALDFNDASIIQTQNQQTVSTLLEALDVLKQAADPNAPTGELDAVIDRVIASTPDQARNTFNQLAGGGAATMSTQVAAAAVNQSHRVLDQVVGIAPGSTRPISTFSQQQPQQGMPYDPVNFDSAEHLTLMSMAPTPQPRQAAPRPAGLAPTGWASIYGGFGEQGDGPEAIDYTRYGAVIGLDYDSVESASRYGISLGYEKSDFDFDGTGGNSDINSFYVALYTRQPLGGNFYFGLTGSFGYHSFETSRSILIGMTPAQASADFNSYSATVAAELSRSYAITRTSPDPGNPPTDTTIEPFARIDYSYTSQDSYQETNAGTAGLAVDATDFDSLRASVGIRAQHQFLLFNRYESVLQGRGLVDFAITNSESDLNVSFIDTPAASSFNVEGSDQDDIFGVIGVGFSVEVGGNWDLHLDIDQQFSDSAVGTLLSAGLSYSF